jgi:hypothetical protein
MGPKLAYMMNDIALAVYKRKQNNQRSQYCRIGPNNKD